MEHTKGILLECNLSEEEINTVIEALSRDYVENDAETLVFISDKDIFVSLNNGLYFVTEFDEYDLDLETDQPYFRV